MIAPLDLEENVRPAQLGRPALRLQLSGVPGAWRGGRWIAFQPDKRYVLLAYLAIAAGWVNREKLADLFWPESSTDKAFSNLRQLLMRVTALDWIGSFERDRDRLRWLVATDLQDVESAARRGDHEAGLRFIRGPFLDGIDCDDSAVAASWLQHERERLMERRRSLRLELADDLARAGAHERAAAVLEEILAADDLDEEATFAYMQLSVAAGRPLHALRAYQRFSRRSRDELGMEPCRFTSLLAEQIRRGGSPGRPEPLLVAHAVTGA